MMNYINFTKLKWYCCVFLFLLLQLLEELKKVTFTDNEKEVHFDAKGDLNMGYDVLLWKEISGHMVITEIAEYDLQKDDFIFKDEEKEMEFLNFQVSGGHTVFVL